MTPIIWYSLGIPLNAGFMIFYLRRRRRLWVFNAVSLVWCVGSVIRLSGVMG